ncbi:MAG TPA: peptide ligase PGM1-related protein [Pseudonocardiaceae bacterium]|nr:peptide ligase PGM1-related protein [Pseudonocardiaceae bacterium]
MLTAVPYARYFGERSLSELAALRDADVRVVVINADKIDPWIIDHALMSLSAGDEPLRRDMRRRLRCLVPSSGSHTSLDEAVLADPHLIAHLRAAVRSARSALLVNFAASDASDELAERLGVPAEEGPADFANRWGTKSGGKTLLHESGVRCARGELDVAHSEEAVVRLARRLATADPPAERVIVKLDSAEWASGIGNAVVRCEALLRTGDLRRSVERLPQPWEDYSSALADSGAIVEEYLPGATSSPSAQGYVRGHGEAELLAVHEQILVEDEYLGCIFPAGKDVAPGAGDALRRLGMALNRRGFRGSFGIDFIVAAGRLYATEVNLRKVGPSHVIKAVHAHVAQETPGKSHSIMGMPVAYLHRRLYKPELLTALTPDSALGVLHRHQLTYDSVTRTGTLLHILGALRPAGFVETTSIARTSTHASEIDEQATVVLTAAARTAYRRIDGRDKTRLTR